MDRQETSIALSVMVAYANGGEVQHRVRGQTNGWRDVEAPSWTWGSAEYRVKPAPVEFWAVLNDDSTPIQCYVQRYIAERHLAGNFNTPNWRIAHMREVP